MNEQAGIWDSPGENGESRGLRVVCGYICRVFAGFSGVQARNWLQMELLAGVDLSNLKQDVPSLS